MDTEPVPLNRSNILGRVVDDECGGNFGKNVDKTLTCTSNVGVGMSTVGDMWGELVVVVDKFVVCGGCGDS